MRKLVLLAPPFLALAFVVMVLGAPTTAADNTTDTPLVYARTTAAIDAGLRFLARTQNEDGSWSSDAGKKINESYRKFENGAGVHHVGVTSLAILAYLAGGHLPERGPYGTRLKRAVDFVLRTVQPSGYIAAHGTRMYSHAFATLALAEVYGATSDERIRVKLEQAVEHTVKCRSSAGGWRYVPYTQDSDMSITVCQVVALRAARNVGIKVPRRAIRDALRYVIESAVTRDGRWSRGSFLYQPSDIGNNRESYALSAAGLTTLFQAGLYDDPALARYVDDHKIEKRPPPRIEDIVGFMTRGYNHARQYFPEHYFYYYGTYYAAQAMYQVGSTDPRLWRTWYRQVRDDILAKKRSLPRGAGGAQAYWRSNVDSTHNYATAAALLILQFPLDHLPIHQR